MRKCFWNQSEELPSTPHETIKKVDKDTFPFIFKTLKPLILILSTAATVERAHLSLKSVKNNLRFTMSEDRINNALRHKDLSAFYNVRRPY